METIGENVEKMKLVPFTVIQKAVEGDIISINKVLRHYEGYIIYPAWLFGECMMNMEMSIIV